MAAVTAIRLRPRPRSKTMSLPAIIMWVVVLAIGIPSAWTNPTAAALVICWIFGEAIYVLTGDSLPVEYYAYPDIFVLAVILAKPEHCRHEARGAWQWLKCILLERSPADRVVMLIFPVMWIAYVSDMGARDKWFLLWGLTIAQFLAAGWESLAKSIRRRAENATPSPDVHGSLLVAHGSGGYG